MHWVLVTVWAFSSCGEQGYYSSWQCMGFSLCGFFCCRAQALGVWVSVTAACSRNNCGSWALECGLSSCSAWGS